jgi:hypothetical protein
MTYRARMVREIQCAECKGTIMRLSSDHPDENDNVLCDNPLCRKHLGTVGQLWGCLKSGDTDKTGVLIRDQLLPPL